MPREFAAEFGHARAVKPSPTGLAETYSISARELLRPFHDGRLLLSTPFLIAHGYSGETTEVFAYPTDPTYPTPIERVVGVPLKFYITATITYRFFR